MKTKFFFILMINLLIFSSTDVFSVKKENKKSKKENQKNDKDLSNVIAKVGDENITYDELEKAFQKNLYRKDSKIKIVPKDSIYDFLNLYITYRLKVNDAISKGLAKDSTIKAEIVSNRRLLAESFFYDKMLVEPNVNQLLEYRKKDLQISIILFTFPAGLKNDTITTYNRAKASLELIKSGKFIFEKVAQDSSDDTDSRGKGGKIPRFLTGGRVQRPIENAIYTLKPGEVYPNLVNTKYGYFIVKLLKSEPRIKVKCRQILLVPDASLDTNLVAKRADSLIALLKTGSNFSELAKKYSQDPQSAQKGGELGGWYSRSSGFDGSGRELISSFAEELFNMKDGSISKIKSDAGYHIIIRDSSILADVETEREDLKKIYRRLYFEEDKKSLIEQYKNKFGFDINQLVFNQLLALQDTNKTNIDSAAFLNLPKNLLESNLFKVGSNDFSVKKFIELSETRNELKGLGTNREGFNKAIDKIANPIVFDMATENLEKEYPDFYSLLKEFRDGILLFKVETSEVFDRLKFDSVLAKTYYDTTKSKYKTQLAYNISEIYVLNDTLANEIYSKLKNGEDFSKLAEQYTQRAGYREKKGNWGKVYPKDNLLAKIASNRNMKEGEIIGPEKFEKGFSIIKLVKLELPRQKTFQEAISDFAPDFQDMMQKRLSEKWVNEIKKRIPVEIYKEKLDKLIKN